ncbi:MAG: hypothetical protein QG594_2250 [Bacteroidota bacterium]|nr:hypothetical protein [Bacteroidota bacterium]MDQ5957557.1 hypothetical protein [Patescibacteria group bacterium]
MENLNQKCELCSMVATHSEIDTKDITHYFCQHHSLKNIPTAKINHLRLIPLFSVFILIIALSLIRQFLNGTNFMMWMMDFMGIFFLIFGLFKLYDLKGFVQGFQTYDVITKKIPQFGYTYPFIEVILGITYLAGFMFVWQNLIALMLASFGLYSAYVALKNKEEIQCVCLGTFFNLPMTYITLLENGVMFGMALFMLLM